MDMDIMGRGFKQLSLKFHFERHAIGTRYQYMGFHDKALYKWDAYVQLY